MIIGVDVGGTKIEAGLVDGKRILKKAKIPTGRGRKSVISNILEAIDSVYDNKVKGIGIGFPSPVVKGVVYNETNITSLYNVNLKQIVQKRFRKKVVVDNDANCFALAQGRNVVGVTLGTGIGVGIVIDGKIYAGATGCVGEYSRIPLCTPLTTRKFDDFGDRCLKELIKKSRINKPAEDVAALAKKGNGKAKKVFEQYGERLGIVLSVIINTIDPEVIVLGGSISKSHSLFRKTMMASLKKNIYRHTAKKIQVKVSKVKDSGVLGAAMLVG